MATTTTDFTAEREAMVERQLQAPRDCRAGDPRRVSRGSARGVRQRRICAPCLWRPSASDRGRADDFAALHRRLDDPGGGDQAGRHGARGGRRLRLCGGGDQPDRRPSDRHRAAARPGGSRARAAAAARLRQCRDRRGRRDQGLAATMRRSMPSLPRPAGAMCRGHCSSSLRPAAASSCRWANLAVFRS